MTALPIETAHETSVGRIRALDGVRGLAVLGVMLFHFALQLRPDHAPTAILKWLLVAGPRLDVFFVLSGFLVTGLLYDAKNRPNYYKSFYARRMLRILPLYYGALTLLFLVPYLVGAENFQVPFKEQLWYWFYLQNFRPLPPLFVGLAWHFWSLAIEQQFYLLWPFVILRTSRETALKVCVALICLSITYRMFSHFGGVGRGVTFPTPARLDGIAAGSAIALLMRGPHGLEPVRKWLHPVFVAAVAYVALFMAVGNLGYDRKALFPLYFTGTAIFFGSLLVYAIHAGNGVLGSMLRSRSLAFFGKYGYGLYVLHVPLISLADYAGWNPGIFSAIPFEMAGALVYITGMLALSTAAALVSWHLWEKQFLKLRPKREAGAASR